jgi:hypothetical protein
MMAVKSGNVERCGSCARRVVGSSFRDSESSECVSGMVVISCLCSTPQSCNRCFAVGTLLGADNVEARLV